MKIKESTLDYLVKDGQKESLTIMKKREIDLSAQVSDVIVRVNKENGQLEPYRLIGDIPISEDEAQFLIQKIKFVKEFLEYRKMKKELEQKKKLLTVK